jgi:hypothetical protein
VRIVLWTVVLGIVGFLSGFVGPILLAPDANQGPLLGLFLTGPGGLIVGAMLGSLASLLRLSRKTNIRALAVVSILLAAITLYVCTQYDGHRLQAHAAPVPARAEIAT